MICDITFSFELKVMEVVCTMQVLHIRWVFLRIGDSPEEGESVLLSPETLNVYP
jgi:hypothetical protein